MITLITGAPGAGKSAALVAMLAETDPARLVYVSGVPELSLPGRTVHQLEDPASWPDTVPDGALVVIDEVQRVWRPRAAGQAIPRDIAELETHRHRGLDFIIVTQNPGLLHKNVRALTGRHVHLRDVGFLGRWWYEWPECCENCLTGWKTAPVKKRYRLPKRVFGFYRSASMHIKGERSFPMMVAVGVGALVLALAASVWAFRSITDRTAEPVKTAAQTPTDTAATAQGAGQGARQGTDTTHQVESAPAQAPRLIDDRVDWIPRVSIRPESAPAYDHLRQVRVMPVVVGGYCSRKGCRCYTQQATDAGLSSESCRRWIEAPPFDAYTDQFWPERPAVAAPSSDAETPQAEQGADKAPAVMNVTQSRVSYSGP